LNLPAASVDSFNTRLLAHKLGGRVAEDIRVSFTFLGVSPSKGPGVAVGMSALMALLRQADGRNFVGEFHGRVERHNGDVVDLYQKSTSPSEIIITNSVIE
jgi:hypothetical protein